MNKTFLVVVVIAVLGGGYYLINKQAASQPVMQEITGSPTQAKMEKGAAEFTVEGTPFAFSVKEMRVKKGDTVTVTFVNKEGMHDWVLDEFNVKTKQIKAGETETVTFVADAAGTFEYYCSVGEHRAKGMIGKLIVE